MALKPNLVTATAPGLLSTLKSKVGHKASSGSQMGYEWTNCLTMIRDC